VPRTPGTATGPPPAPPGPKIIRGEVCPHGASRPSPTTRAGQTAVFQQHGRSQDENGSATEAEPTDFFGDPLTACLLIADWNEATVRRVCPNGGP
jgi:hypothetical protein